MDGFRNALAEFGISLQVQHAFSVELDSAKREFIKAVRPSLGTQFADVAEVASERAHNLATGSENDVADIHIGWSGFPCPDASPLNPAAASASNRSCVLNKNLRTGGVFAGIISYMKVHGNRLVAFFLENSAGLRNAPKEHNVEIGPSNLDVCVHMLETDADSGLHSKRLFWGRLF